MDKVLELANKTQGRDKLYRSAQYACKLIGWACKELEWNPDVVKKLAVLESNASTTRKFLRLGKSLESFRSAQTSIHLLDPMLRYTLTLTHLHRSVFLLIDHYLWLGRIGIVKVDKKWEYISSRFYLVTIILSIARDLYAFYLDYLCKAREKNQTTSCKSFNVICESLSSNQEATLDLIKNLSDFPIPGTKLGYFPNHSGVVGLLGLISSLIGVYQTAFPYMKLRP